MDLYLQKSLNNSLRPVFESDFENIKKLKAGTNYKVSIKRERNPLFHRKFFALINMVYNNQDRYNSIDMLRKDLTIEAGFYTEFVDIHGEIRKEAKSISFSKMKETEFEGLFNKVIDVIIKYFGFDYELIMENIQDFY